MEKFRVLRVVSIWVMFILYVALIVYLSTAFLPPELPEEDEDEDDTLYGGGGDDTLDGGAGTDLLSGGNGNDTLHGGEDEDTLRGNDGSDWLYASVEADTYSQSADNRTVCRPEMPAQGAWHHRSKRRWL